MPNTPSEHWTEALEAELTDLIPEVLMSLGVFKNDADPEKKRRFLELKALHGTSFFAPMSPEDARAYGEIMSQVGSPESGLLPRDLMNQLGAIHERYTRTVAA